MNFCLKMFLLQLALTAFVYLCGGHPLARSAIVVASLSTFFFHSKKMREEEEEEEEGLVDMEKWWHRPIHMLASIIIALFFIVSGETNLPSAILLADIALTRFTLQMKTSLSSSFATTPLASTVNSDSVSASD